MKFSELKGSLKEKVASGYYLFGEDVFLMYKALNLIEKACVVDFPMLNEVVFDGDKTILADDVLNSLLVLPIGQDKRLVVIKDGSKIKKDQKVLEKIKNELKSNNQICLVLFESVKCEFFDELKNLCESVDCNKIDFEFAKVYIDQKLKKSQKTISEQDARLIYDLCCGFMGRIDGEVEKLANLSKQSEISKEEIENNIEPDFEFKIFELGDNLSKKNSEKVFIILDKLLADKDLKFAILPNLYSLFSRMLFAGVTNDDALVAKEFGVKPYAIIKAKELAKKYSQSALKNICEQISNAELDYKSGAAEYESAIYALVFQILAM